MKKITIAFCLLLLVSLTAVANDPKLFAVENVRQGMKGYGMTVFQGTKPERFEVEVLGVVKGFANPKQSIIIARLSGGQVDKTGVFAGMSGSPVYIDDKLVGAVAYAFPFSKEPIAGIQPIQNMLDQVEKGSDQEPRQSAPLSFNTLLGKAESTDSTLATLASLRAVNSGSGQLIPIATPVTFSGVPQKVLDLFADDLRKVGIQPIAGLGSSSSNAPMAVYDDNTLTAGSSITAQLARGDFSYDASGTVTYRDGERIFAFGHPFLASGATSWPMAESQVVTVIANLNNSFKITTTGNLVGAINQDRATCIYGNLGDKPRMIPVKLTVRTSRNKTETYNFELISDPMLAPILMRIALTSAILGTERQLGPQTVKVNGRIALKDQPDVVIDNAFSLASGATVLAATSIERPFAVLLNSGFDGLEVRGIDVEVTSSDTRSLGIINRLWIDKTEVGRGEKVEIQAFARKENGTEFVERIPVEIPQDAPIGPIVILIGDGSSLNQADARMQAGADFVPKNLGQLVQAINKLKKNSKLYVKILRPGAGAIINSEEMPTLPPSMLATLGSQRTSSGYAPLSVSTLSEKELAPSQFLIAGQQAITINVVR
ncbi:MAG: hypothetical protein HY231_04970 [Acidobacteria bacterium]|nr:hypothetical protein [Acidobacteriota bacterium]